MDEHRQKEMMQLLREELKYSLKEELHAQAEESCLQVDLSIQRVLRRLPPEFRNMPSTEAFRLGALEHVSEAFQCTSNGEEGRELGPGALNERQQQDRSLRERNASKEASSKRAPDTARSTKASSIGSVTTMASPPGSGLLYSSPGSQTITRGSIDSAIMRKSDRPLSQPVEASKSLKALKAALSTKEADALPPKVADEAAENVQKGEALARLEEEIRAADSMMPHVSSEERNALVLKVQNMYEEIAKAGHTTSDTAECSPCAG